MMAIRTHENLPVAEYETLRSGHQGVRRREFLARVIGSRTPPPTRVLEVGYGSGRLLAELAAEFPEVEFWGTELDPKMVAWARDHYRRPNIRYEAQSLGRLAAGALAGSCDVVFSVDLIHHVHAHAAFFADVRRAMRPQGWWIALEPNIYHPYIFISQERMKRAGFDEDHFRPWRVDPLLHAAGFRIARREYMLLYPACVRRVPRLLAGLERALERFPLLGGCVVYRLIAV
jgi:SAM-dependent methyltransferase